MAMYYLGVDLGGTNIAAAVVDETGKILAKDSVKTRAQRPAEEIIRDMGALCQAVACKSGVSMEKIPSIGIGTPGTVDQAKGEIVYANNLPFRNVPACRMLEEMLGKPVYLENDANCAALGEYTVLENKEAVQCFAAITLGTGVGSGVIIDGKVFSGTGAAVEFGHTAIVVNGRKCTCGRKGCWEQYASATALVRQTRHALERDKDTVMWEMAGREFGHVSGRTAFAAARQGDRLGKKVVSQYIEYVGIGLTNLANAFRPELIVLSGGISKEGEFLIRPLQEYVNENAYCREAPIPKIQAATLFNDAGIIGAAFLGR